MFEVMYGNITVVELKKKNTIDVLFDSVKWVALFVSHNGTWVQRSSSKKSHSLNTMEEQVKVSCVFGTERLYCIQLELVSMWVLALHLNCPAVVYVRVFVRGVDGWWSVGRGLHVAGRYSPEAPHSYVEKRLTLFLARSGAERWPKWSQPRRTQTEVLREPQIPASSETSSLLFSCPNSIAIKLFLAAVQKTTEQTSPRTPPLPPSPQLRTSSWDIGDRQSSSLNKSLTS